MNIGLASTMSLRLAPLLLAPALLAGCGGGFVVGGLDCESEMAALTGTRGFPEQVERRTEAGLHIHTFWYWKSGIGITFIWGEELSCERRDFAFTPVR